MRIEIEPTEQWDFVNGAPCRVWKTTGTDHAEALFFVAGVAVPVEGHPHAADFERELVALATNHPKQCTSVCNGHQCLEDENHGGWHRNGGASWAREPGE